jgi:hypothetical protein
MGPAKSTSTIPQFCIQYVKYQNTLAVRVTRSDLKNALMQQHKTAPWLFGTSNNGNEPSSWVSSVYPTFRSMYSRMKNGTGGQHGMEDDLKVVVVDGVDYIFDKEDTFLKAQLGLTFKQQVEGVDKEPVDIHTLLQFNLTSVGVAAGLKVFIPFKNRNIKIENGMTINSVFGEHLVDDFIGMSDITREIDVIFLEETEDGFVPYRSYEVENSTGVITGIGRMKALSCHGVIVSPHKQYKEKFEKYMKESFTEMKGKLTYKSSSEIFKFSETVEEYSGDGLDMGEIKSLILKKA